MKEMISEKLLSKFKVIIEDLFEEFLRGSKTLLEQTHQKLSSLKDPLENSKQTQNLDFSFILDSFTDLNTKFRELQNGHYDHMHSPQPTVNSQTPSLSLDQIRQKFSPKNFEVDISELVQLQINRVKEASQIANNSQKTEELPSSQLPKETESKQLKGVEEDKEFEKPKPKEVKPVSRSFFGMLGFGGGKKKEKVFKVELQEDETKAVFCPIKKKWIFEGEDEEDDDIPLPPPKKTVSKTEEVSHTF